MLSLNILPIFQQLGLLDELLRICMRGKDFDVYGKNVTRIGGSQASTRKICSTKALFVLYGMTNSIGYDIVFLWRPNLYDWLLSQIPTSKIHMS